MIVEEKKQHRMKDLLSAALEQSDKINRIIFEVEPDFERSKLRALLRSDKWPEAVNPNVIIDRSSSEDMFSRAENILDLMDVMLASNLSNKKFLDFGCGQGHIARAAADRSTYSVGYDIDEEGWEHFEETPRFMLTNDLQVVKSKGPYDAILLYDVLDHIVEEDPIDILKFLNGVLTPTGRIYVRCHPWCSKSGTHVYHQINKAWIHMFFSDEEIVEMGGKPIPTLKITHPIATYANWFEKGGFKRHSENIKREQVESFFTSEDILIKTVKEHWKNSIEERLASGKEYPKFQLEQTFLDFVLVKDDK
jgi:2-polyprenyl-3-methyl-5-hydroxy-6-metoxy-1,4-benzoquinol methylase